jgi:hypothetical protein
MGLSQLAQDRGISIRRLETYPVRHVGAIVEGQGDCLGARQ